MRWLAWMLMLTLLAGCVDQSFPLQENPLPFLKGNMSRPVLLPEGVAYTLTLEKPLGERDAWKLQRMLIGNEYEVTGMLVKEHDVSITAYSPKEDAHVTIRYTPGSKRVHVMVLKDE